MSRNPAPTSRIQDTQRRDASIILALVFIAGAGVTLMLTLGGVHALVALVTTATTFKSGIITSVLGLGLVVLGPVLLWGLAAILPRWWFADVKCRIRKLFRGRFRSADS